MVVEPLAAVRAALETRFDVETLDAPSERLAGCDAFIIAVKPQQMRAATCALGPHLGAGLVISIAAGIGSASIAQWLGRNVPIVRAMPNTPALIGAGITGLFATPLVSPEQRALADQLLCAVGSTVWVEREGLLDAVTAVSGSGPAYVFYFIEALEHAARELGLSAEASARLALGTFGGAIRLAEASKDPLAVLRERVTSKGGTTAAALAHLSASEVEGLISEAVRAAARRAEEMGREFGAQ